MWYFEEGDVVLWRGLDGTLKRVMWYFEEGDVILWRGWCGTLKMVRWYFEEGDVVLWRGWCGTLKRVIVYIFMFIRSTAIVPLWRGWCGTLKRVMWYFKGGDCVYIYVLQVYCNCSTATSHVYCASWCGHVKPCKQPNWCTDRKMFIVKLMYVPENIYSQIDVREGKYLKTNWCTDRKIFKNKLMYGRKILN